MTSKSLFSFTLFFISPWCHLFHLLSFTTVYSVVTGSGTRRFSSTDPFVTSKAFCWNSPGIVRGLIRDKFMTCTSFLGLILNPRRLPNEARWTERASGTSPCTSTISILFDRDLYLLLFIPRHTIHTVSKDIVLYESFGGFIYLNLFYQLRVLDIL
jgi:hypothetical protein